jgi:hypothetical protein
MWIAKTALATAAAIACASGPALALEGSSAAGPIGGTDIRSAQLPPPGVYGGGVTFVAKADQFFDRNGDLVPALRDLDLFRSRLAPFVLWVPDVEVLGGHIGIAAIVPFAPSECGHLFAITPTRCSAGVGDPYAEIGWSRYFGTRRPSKYAGAYPVAEGLTVALGFGTVFPVGTYDVFDATVQGLAIGNNIWVFAPTAAFTYVTRPILADGTEFSARFYWNNYLKNPATEYLTGTLLDIDFAVTEKIGRFQVGLAGFYSWQVEDDKLFGVSVPPDGRRTELLNLGAVAAYDIPEYGAFLKVKVLSSVIYHNIVKSYGVAFTLAKKL